MSDKLVGICRGVGQMETETHNYELTTSLGLRKSWSTAILPTLQTINWLMDSASIFRLTKLATECTLPDGKLCVHQKHFIMRLAYFWGDEVLSFYFAMSAAHLPFCRFALDQDFLVAES